ncbi:MAG: hypothetical protein U1E39_11200 [Planctomycetota bacterium]
MAALAVAEGRVPVVTVRVLETARATVELRPAGDGDRRRGADPVPRRPAARVRPAFAPRPDARRAGP